MLDSKLQIKNGQTLALLNNPEQVDVAVLQAAPDAADAILVFAKSRRSSSNASTSFAKRRTAAP